MPSKNAENHLYVPYLPEHQGSFWNEFQLLKPLKMRVDLTFHDAYWFDGENISNNRTMEINNFSFNGAAAYFGLQTGF